LTIGGVSSQGGASGSQRSKNAVVKAKIVKEQLVDYETEEEDVISIEDEGEIQSTIRWLSI
jgi:hypothetical protein